MSDAIGHKCLVTFWGTRGSIPTPGRLTEKYGGNTACVSVEYNNELIVFDAGSGIRPLGIMLAEKMKEGRGMRKVHLFLTHTHWDHIQGLPFFTPAYLPETELFIYSGPSKAALIREILSGQMDLNYFPVEMSVFGADLHFIELAPEPLSIGDLKVHWQEQVYHSGGSLRFRVTAGERRIVFATDVEIDQAFNPPSEDAERKRHAEEYMAFIQDADLLIGDGQYTSEEYESKRGWGHSSVEMLLNVARRAGVSQVAAFHHDPARSDRKLDSLHARYQGLIQSWDTEMQFFWAREGMTLAI